jgi:hypothetical protein
LEVIDDMLTGPIKYLITDVEAKEIQLFPMPETNGSLKLFIKRLPMKDVTDKDSILEIDKQHHLSLLCWVKYRSFLKQDVETFDGTKAADFREDFTAAIALATKEKSAREDRKRKVQFSW